MNKINWKVEQFSSHLIYWTLLSFFVLYVTLYLVFSVHCWQKSFSKIFLFFSLCNWWTTDVSYYVYNQLLVLRSSTEMKASWDLWIFIHSLLTHLYFILLTNYLFYVNTAFELNEETTPSYSHSIHYQIWITISCRIVSHSVLHLHDWHLSLSPIIEIN